MGIINTFYIMFKSNAEDVIKGNKEISRSTKETARDLENTNDKAASLGQSFVKTVEGLASIGGAVAGFNIVKAGINDTANFNAQLKIMGDLTKQNVGTLKQMGQAAAAAGGSATGALADIQGLTNMAAQSGKPLGPVNDYMAAVRDRLKNYSPNERQAALGRIGINDPGLRWLLSVASDQEYAKRMGRAGQVSPLSQSSADAAFEKIGVDADLGGAKGTFWTKLWDTVKNPVNALNRLRTDATLEGAGSGAGALAGAGAIIGGSAFGAGGLAKMLLGRGGAGVAARMAGIGLGAGGVAAGSLAGGVMAGGPIVEWLAKKGFLNGAWGLNQEDWNGAIEMSHNKGAALTSRISSGSPAIDFWVQKGYTPAQAAGIMANMQHESGGNPMARGDGGQAHGLFQWHPDRRENIMKNTGIDVSSAGFMDQMEAAAWEMKNGRAQFSDEYFRSIGDADAAAAYFSQKFESPANGAIQAMLRGKTALGMVSQLGANPGGNSTSVQIDKIEINTQATDANGIANEIGQQLHSQLSYLEANYDDGIDK